MLCKVCECGEVLKFDKIYNCPDPCPKCGRITQSYITYHEDDPLVEMLSKKYALINGDLGKNDSVSEASPMGVDLVSKYVFVSVRKGFEIFIPNEGCIIGRTELGAEELADNPAVSKQHIVVTINKKFGLFIEDISKYGTLVNGREILKGSKVHIKENDEITLYNEKFIVKVR